MNFDEFQNQSRLYVIGALEPGEVEEFESERKKRASAKNPAKKRKISLAAVTRYMKHSNSACAR